MIAPNVPCFFTLKTSGEAAEMMVSEIAPRIAADITEMTLISADHTNDMSVVEKLDAAVQRVSTVIKDLDIDMDERYNPLYLPVKMEDLDDILQADIRGEALRFSGFDGNPFTIKLVEGQLDEERLVTAYAQYHPFELPSYNEIVEKHERFRSN
jgi:hypothetical protein